MTAPYAPAWTTPSAPGQLSNLRGSNTGADALTLTAAYAHPNGKGDQAGTIRVTASRLLNSGVAQTAESSWDSGWVGNPTLTNIGTLNQGAVYGTTFVYQGRVYYASRSNTGQIASAPVTGASVSTHRSEPSPPSSVYINNYLCSLQWVQSMTQIGGFVYALCKFTFTGGNTDRLMVTTVNGDGTLNPWRFALFGGTGMSGTYASQIVGVQDTKSGAGNPMFLLQLGGSDASGSSATNTCFALQINSTTGDFVDYGFSQTNLPANRKLHGVAFVPSSNQVWVIGGDDGVSAQSTVYQCVLTLTAAAYAAGTMVPSWTTDTALPAARTGAAVCYAPLAGSNGGTLYVVGGSSTLVAGGGTSTVYSNQAYNAGAALPAWTAQANGLDAAKWLLGAAASDSQQFTSGTNVGNPLIVVGGVSTTSANLATVLALPITQSTGATGANVTGTGTALATSNMGTNGSVTANGDGTQSITFSYLGFGGPATARFTGGFSDGDLIQFAVQVTDDSTGMPSPISYTLVKIGQAPTITSAAASANGGQPTVTFAYNAGAGGGPELSYQVTATGFDSGVRYDGANSVAVLEAPMLANAVQVTITIKVTSTDTALPGSTNTATTTVNYTPAYTAPAVPTGITATPNNAGGYVTVGWTHPGGSTATSSRIYYRRNGTATWYLLVDSIATAGAGTYSQVVADQLALGVAYDFTVSAVGAGPGESAQGTAVTNIKIDPVAGGYNAMLHIAGQVATYSAPLAILTTPQIQASIDSAITDVFGAQAPLARYGVRHFRTVSTRAFLKDAATAKNLITLVQQAMLGGVVYYRDAFGTMLTVALDRQPRIEFKPPVFRYTDVTLIEVANTYSPSTTSGSATGYLPQANGTVTPLDASETGI